jgi:hypothetical protein
VSTNAPAQLSTPNLAGGGFSFTLAGAPQGTYIIEASTNLMLWQPVATNTLPVNGVLQIGDPLGTAFSRRYYRAVKNL